MRVVRPLLTELVENPDRALEVIATIVPGAEKPFGQPGTASTIPPVPSPFAVPSPFPVGRTFTVTRAFAVTRTVTVTVAPA